LRRAGDHLQDMRPSRSAPSPPSGFSWSASGSVFFAANRSIRAPCPNMKIISMRDVFIFHPHRHLLLSGYKIKTAFPIPVRQRSCGKTQKARWSFSSSWVAIHLADKNLTPSLGHDLSAGSSPPAPAARELVLPRQREPSQPPKAVQNRISDTNSCTFLLHDEGGFRNRP